MDTKKLRQKILDLAIRGKLVPQDPNDEPASVLLERIKAEKEQLIKEGKIKRSKKSESADKPHYENVPFEIPESWVWCRLDDLAFYKKGPFGSSLTKSMFIPDNRNAYKVYEQKNAIQKNAGLGHYFISYEKFQELKGFEVLPNDIIVSCAGTIGETYIMPSDIRQGIINQALMIIRLHNLDITPFYLLYFDFILKNEAGKDGKGTAIKNIPPFDILKNYMIPLPPLAEQSRIIKEVAVWKSFTDSIDENCDDILNLCNDAKSKILDLAISGKLVPQDHADEPAIELLKRINPDFKSCDNSHYEKLPNGWTKAEFKDIFKTIPIRDCQIQQRDIANKGEYPVISQSLNYIEGYSNRKDKVLEINKPVIVFGDHTRIVKYIDFPFIIGADGVKVIETNIDAKYAYYLLLNASSIIENKGYSRHFQFLSKYQYIIPPLAEQKRIIKALDDIYNLLDEIVSRLT